VYGTPPNAGARSPQISFASSLQALSEVGQHMLDRVGAAITVQCHPSAVPEAERYASNEDAGTPDFFRCPCVGSWLIEAAGEGGATLDVCGGVTQAPQTAGAGWFAGVVVQSQRPPSALLTLDAELVNAGRDADVTTEATATTVRVVLPTAFAVSTVAYSPLAYQGMLIGSGGFPVSTADLLSLSVLRGQAAQASVTGDWFTGEEDAGTYTQRTATLDVTLPTNGGLGATIMYCRSAALALTRPT
jgi:hypothetical protein